MFTSAGEKQLIITAADTAESQFNKDDSNAFDVCLTCKEVSTGETGIWRGEFSNRYGAGKMSDRFQREITTDVLQKLGLQGEDLSTLDTLVGVKTVGTVESRTYKEKLYFDLKYLGGGSALKKIDKTDAAARLRALMDGAAQAPTAPAMPTPAAPAPSASRKDPFARKAQ